MYRHDRFRVCLVRNKGDKNEIRFDLRYDEALEIGNQLARLILDERKRRKNEKDKKEKED